MIVSRNWIERYVGLDGIDDSAVERALTMVGFEVEGVTRKGLPPLENIVVGEVVSHGKHPNADRLSVCQVRVDGGDPRTIVCGAKNFADGDRVIVALPGAVLPGDFEIKVSKLRGVESQGMMCSERELGLGEDHAGIAVLTDRPEIGTSVNEVFDAGDTLFDIEITPNRPDALSHIGIARELAAWFKRDLVYPDIRVNLLAGPGGHLVESVVSETEENCPHYRGYSIRGVKIGPSPHWLKTALESIGLRPVNNVVDATNFVLHELGQPLHAFDVKKIRGDRIVVRQARKGERITTLDDKNRTLDSGMMVIADAERALVVAGVMGSVDAEVDDTTVDIFLESAYFNPSSVRRTARTLGLSTDSSYRFERGVDPKGAEYAALRCIDLIVELAGGEVLGPPLVAGEPPFIEREIELSPAWVRGRLGFDISDEGMAAHLGSLELDVRETTDGDDRPLLLVGVPSFRLDLYRPIDLVEEILRLHGTDKVPPAEVRTHGLLADDDPLVVFTRRAASLLIGRGYQEVAHYSLRDGAEVKKWYGHCAEDSLALTNPLASDASHLRPSLIPGLLDCFAFNQARLNPLAPVFETGRVFREYDGKVFEMLSIAFALPREGTEGWLRREPVDFHAVARVVRDIFLLAGVSVDPARFEPVSGDNAWQAGHAARFGGFKMGFEAAFGVLGLTMTSQWDLRTPVCAGALYFTPEYLKREPRRRRYQAFSAFPPATRDLALVVPVGTAAGHVRTELQRVARQAAKGTGIEVESVDVFDVYRGKGIPADAKSLAFSIVFRSPERTLTDKEVNPVFDAIQEKIVEGSGYSVRK
ncbi:MAG: phenylalanine--tRNA ligase subunit beta [Opitutales bacterium]|nr:phenylalanine--tRNA ligase subunit beta [Opitutales bacterium]